MPLFNQLSPQLNASCAICSFLWQVQTEAKMDWWTCGLFRTGRCCRRAWLRAVGSRVSCGQTTTGSSSVRTTHRYQLAVYPLADSLPVEPFITCSFTRRLWYCLSDMTSMCAMQSHTQWTVVMPCGYCPSYTESTFAAVRWPRVRISARTCVVPSDTEHVGPHGATTRGSAAHTLHTPAIPPTQPVHHRETLWYFLQHDKLNPVRYSHKISGNFCFWCRIYNEF